ncbi:glycoside hydrolase family 127 protein [Granulicella paludicola]|uniref:glycoside hydrolase family 127 protein n=1 Tax=Granulicella paludicola TaxID=474951 RepID=UPI0021DF5141|nr:glycoside hydrolase family 127 protein [Granulicella paludicola]
MKNANAAINRRHFLAAAAGTALLSAVDRSRALASVVQSVTVNLAKVATPSASYISGDTRLTALNDGFDPTGSDDDSRGSYGNWPHTDAQWVQYDWARPVTTNRVDIYWWADGQGVGLPASYTITYWNGSAFIPVSNPKGLSVSSNGFNSTTFDEVKTDKLRVEMASDGKHSTGILEWKVYSSGAVPLFPPTVEAGVDRAVVLGGKTYLSGSATWLNPASTQRARWAKTSGPGQVVFADATAQNTTATFSEPGEYVLQLTAFGEKENTHSTLIVHAEHAPPKQRLDVVYTTRYAIDNPMWNERAKTLIVDWIPHCVAQCERTDLTEGQGGLDNFIEAGKALRGEPHGRHKGYVFANAWVHQTVESMCIALMVDPQGDADIAAAQKQMKVTLERWIPIILAAQEHDGYLQTAYTLADRKVWPARWSPEQRGNHEGYVAGYFIESAINHYTLTDGQDLRLYNAAKKLADCWVANIGPSKKAWFDGHQEMEQALVRFGRFVNDTEGNHRGDAYIVLAKFLLDSRRGGQEYDQSHLPPIRQYEAVGHAVRATYFYSGMADIAAETGDQDYQSAVLSLWDNMVNKKYYVTGGIGSGDTSEGFGPNYSLHNDAYCESCSSCGLIFFQYKMNLAYHDAKYADLYEQTMYNALFGAVDMAGKNFCYTNPLVNTQRNPWHVCPCCVGNIPRTLLMVPTWSYTKSADALHVNLFIGGRVHVGKIAGKKLEVVQKTEYPWKGAVAITLHPEEAATFSLHIRVPDRTTSKLYTTTPEVSGLKRLAVNGTPVTPRVVKGYAVITRRWEPGDTVELELPMEVQRIKADPRIRADVNQLALQYGPLIYNVETADQHDLDLALSNETLQAEWRPDLLGGVMVITGKWQDGSPMLAIPNYARMNRVPQEHHEIGGDSSVNYAPGATNSVSTAAAEAPKPRRRRTVESKVWMQSAT